MKEINPKESYAVTAGYGKGKYGKGRGTLIQQPNKAEVNVNSATKQGFEVAKEGDSINLTAINSKTRRGRVGVGVAQTLDTGSNQAVIVAQRGRNIVDGKRKDEKGASTNQRLEINSTGQTNCLTGVQKDNMVLQLNPSKESGGQQPYQQNRVYDVEGIVPALVSSNTHAIGESDFTNIRRLTEIECERLQGFPDNWTELGCYPVKKNVTQEKINHMKNEDLIALFENTVVKKISSTQRYKLCGNAVTKHIVQIIGTKLKPIIYERKINNKD